MAVAKKDQKKPAWKQMREAITQAVNELFETHSGKIAEVLPASQKLSQIYNAQTGIDYNQAEAEKQYLMNSGAATLEQQKLKDLEAAQFQGRSGVVGANVAANYSGSLGKSIQGSF